MASPSALRLVLFGPPGAGKGTIAARFLEGYPPDMYLATGDHFRQLIAEGDARATQFGQFMVQGQLIPDDLVLDEFGNLWKTGRFDEGFIFDGFPRSFAQLNALESILKESGGHRLSKAVLVDASDELVLQRLSSRRVCPECNAIYNLATMPPVVPGLCDKCAAPLIQRPDDNESTIKRRLDVYRRQTAAILRRFEELDLLMTVDASSGVDRIVAEMRAAIAHL